MAITPALANPKITWKTPAKTTAIRNISHEPPSFAIAVKTITAKPAAGPLTPKAEPLEAPTMMPPTIPAISPANSGAPDARATPRHKGTATKNTTILAGRSCLKSLKKFFMLYIS